MPYAWLCHVADVQDRAAAAIAAFDILQNHGADLGKRERLEWLSALTFLRQVLFADSACCDECHAVHQPPAIMHLNLILVYLVPECDLSMRGARRSDLMHFP